MTTLQDFYSPQHGQAFRDALPTLYNEIGRTPFALRSDDCGVSGNTFRGLSAHHRPSEAYRTWAQGICNTLNPQILSKQVGNAEGFREWHANLTETLRDHWSDQRDTALSFAHQNKLVDLFIKWLSGHDFGCPPLNAAFLSHANCALDKQTLTKLSECLSCALPISTPRMGDIHTQQTYDFCQLLITRFAHCYGGTRLLFDYFSWTPGGGA